MLEGGFLASAHQIQACVGKVEKSLLMNSIKRLY